MPRAEKQSNYKHTCFRKRRPRGQASHAHELGRTPGRLQRVPSWRRTHARTHARTHTSQHARSTTRSRSWTLELPHSLRASARASEPVRRDGNAVGMLTLNNSPPLKIKSLQRQVCLCKEGEDGAS
eukprot:3255131-Pleurochrysis_carterae.AAC.2